MLRYNLAEARPARLDRSNVLGRDFFRQIAPCTATQDFEGLFRAFMRGRGPRLAFPFVFDSTFGAQEVQVELVRTSVPGRYYVCINRLAHRAPRLAYEAVAAPRQAELVPGEHVFGVQRDAGQQRIVILRRGAARAALDLGPDRAAALGPVHLRGGASAGGGSR